MSTLFGRKVDVVEQSGQLRRFQCGRVVALIQTEMGENRCNKVVGNARS